MLEIVSQVNAQLKQYISAALNQNNILVWASQNQTHMKFALLE